MRHRVFVLLFTLLVSFAARPPAAHACTTTPPGRPSYTLADKVNAASVILVGTVMAVDDTVYYNQRATIRVLDYLKGGGAQDLEMDNFGSSAACLTSVNVGSTLIFYARGDATSGQLTAFYMSAGAAVENVSDARVDAIRLLVNPLLGTLTASAVPPLAAENSGDTPDALLVVGGVGIGAALLAGGVVILRRKRYTKNGST